MDDLARLDALAQAELVERGELSPAELVEAALERIERIDPTLGAVCARVGDLARRAARATPDGPLRGVPFLLKDVGAHQAGLPHTCGNRALRDARYEAPEDSPLGARLRALGLVTVGVSKTPEFGLQSTTQPLAFGPTRNPWDLERSAGGSSGGACAAVAAGLVPAAHASDGAGSIRIPAAWCGLAALKPSRGRIAMDPRRTELTTEEFVVARSLRDTAAFLDLLSGNTPGELFTSELPRRPFAEEVLPETGRSARRLRVGVMTRAAGVATDPACAAAAEEAGRLLAELGHEVEASWPAALFEVEERALHGLVFGPLEYRSCLAQLETLLRRAVVRDDVEPYLWELAHVEMPAVSAEQYVASLEWQQAWAVRVTEWWADGFDLLVTPTVAVPPETLERLDGAALGAQELLERMGPHMAFTEPFNVTGQPAITLPLGATRDGLPVGVQIVAAKDREGLLMRTAAQLEEARPWADRLPPVHA